MPGIDAVLFGHSHGEFPGRFFAGHPKVDLARGTINGVPSVMPGFWGNHLGVIDLVLDDSAGAWKVKDSHAEIRPGGRRPFGAAGRAGPAGLRPRVLQGTAYEGLPLLSAAAPFKTGGRMGWTAYTDIPAGPLALRNVADLYVYPNTVKLVLLTGAQVREWLEMSAGQFNRIVPDGAAEQELLNPAFPSYNFDTLDGVSYRIDVTQPARYDRNGKRVAADAHRIVDLRFQDQPIDEQARFIVVTNNYRASGGGNFPGLDGSNIVVDAPDENRAALVQYLQSVQRVDPSADGNWRVLPVPGVRLRFLSGAGGIAHLARYPQIVLVKDNGDGSALYELKD